MRPLKIVNTKYRILKKKVPVEYSLYGISKSLHTPVLYIQVIIVPVENPISNISTVDKYQGL